MIYDEKVNNLQVVGSLAVGRRMALGGELRIGGNLHVKQNVKIDGWLDAPNLKSPAKGLYLTLDDLESAHREPRPGSWALVGDSLPAMLYVAKGRRWHSTGHLAGSPLVVAASSSADGEPTPGGSSTACGCRSELDSLDIRVEGAEADADNAMDRARAAGILPFDGFNPLRPGARPTAGVWYVPPKDSMPGNFWVLSSDYGLTVEDYNDVNASTSGNAELAPAFTNRLYRCGSTIYSYDGFDLRVVAGEPVVMNSADEIEQLFASGNAEHGRFYCVTGPTGMVNALYLKD